MLFIKENLHLFPRGIERNIYCKIYVPTIFVKKFHLHKNPIKVNIVFEHLILSPIKNIYIELY